MNQLDPAEPEVWRVIRSTARRALASSLHCSIASNGTDGQPHVTPIGSLMLGTPGKGVYIDVLNVQLGRNLNEDPRVAVMLVDSGRRRWLRALVRKRFETPPGVRLVGTAGPSRPLSTEEAERFRRRVRLATRTKGGHELWGREATYRARDLVFTEATPVRLRTLTAGLWPDPASP